MKNYKNIETKKFLETMNQNLLFDLRQEHQIYRKQLCRKYKILQISNKHDFKLMFNYLKKNGEFLGYLIYEECSFTEDNVSYTMLEYIYLCSGYYCSIIFNVSKKDFNGHSILWGSEVSCSK